MAIHRIDRDEDRDALDEAMEQLELIANTPPTWQELAEAHKREEELRYKLQDLKTKVKIAKADWDLATLVLRQMGRRMRNRRVNPVTGEVRD